MDWRPLPDNFAFGEPVQWVGDQDGEEVAWIIEGRRGGEPGHRWLVATPHGTASGRCSSLATAQRLVEAVLHEHGGPAAAAWGARQSG